MPQSPTSFTPLLGGGALDGERFYGLGNAYAGFVLAGAVLGAAGLSTGWGVALIAGGSLFAGIPWLGADLGGCITLAVAGALWLGLRRWEKFLRGLSDSQLRPRGADARVERCAASSES